MFRTFEKGRESAHVDEQTLSQHKKVDKNTHRELGEAFSQIDWRWNYGEKDCLKLTPGKPIPNKIMDLRQGRERLADTAAEGSLGDHQGLASWKG